MKYENVSRKTLKLPSKSVEPGEKVEKTDLNKNDIESFEARGYLEEVEGSSQEDETASAPEGSSGGESGKQDEEDSSDDIREPSDEFVEKLQKLEGIGGAKAQKIGRDWDSWSTFRDNVDEEYLKDQGLREDQIGSNLKKIEEME